MYYDADDDLPPSTISGTPYRGDRRVCDVSCSSSISDTPRHGYPSAGFASSQFSLPSDPAALNGLLDQLKGQFPSIEIPRELLSGHSVPTEGLLSMHNTQHHVIHSRRLESSIDLNSPRREHPLHSPQREHPLHCVQRGSVPVQQDRSTSPVRGGSPPLQDIPQMSMHGGMHLQQAFHPPPMPVPVPLPVPPAPAPFQEEPERPKQPASASSPRQGFYDKLGRQLTELLLEAGTPLPRFPMEVPCADSTTQTAEQVTRIAASSEHQELQGVNDMMIQKARAAAEMFLKDYQDHKRALSDSERKLNVSENENLALRSQLDLSMVKMMSAQKEVDKYASYFNMSKSGAQQAGSDSAQLKALLRKMQEMSRELKSAHEEKLLLLREEEQRREDAIKQAVADRDAELMRVRNQLKEKKKMIKDMKLMLHSYLATNDPTDVNPKMAFLDMIAHGGQKYASVTPGVAL